jgi:hypothetical protein
MLQKIAEVGGAVKSILHVAMQTAETDLKREHPRATACVISSRQKY